MDPMDLICQGTNGPPGDASSNGPANASSNAFRNGPQIVSQTTHQNGFLTGPRNGLQPNFQNGLSNAFQNGPTNGINGPTNGLQYCPVNGPQNGFVNGFVNGPLSHADIARSHHPAAPWCPPQPTLLSQWSTSNSNANNSLGLGPSQSHYGLHFNSLQPLMYTLPPNDAFTWPAAAAGASADSLLLPLPAAQNPYQMMTMPTSAITFGATTSSSFSHHLPTGTVRHSPSHSTAVATNTHPVSQPSPDLFSNRSTLPQPPSASTRTIGSSFTSDIYSSPPQSQQIFHSYSSLPSYYSSTTLHSSRAQPQQITYTQTTHQVHRNQHAHPMLMHRPTESASSLRSSRRSPMEQAASQAQSDVRDTRRVPFSRRSLASRLIAAKATMRGLEIVDVKDLPENDRVCVICYNDYGERSPENIRENPVRLPRCKHIFGSHCIKRWLRDSNSCPYCRDQLQSEANNVSPSTRTFLGLMRLHTYHGQDESEELYSGILMRNVNGLTAIGTLPDRRRPSEDDDEEETPSRRTRQRRSSSSTIELDRSAPSIAFGSMPPSSMTPVSLATLNHASTSRSGPRAIMAPTTNTSANANANANPIPLYRSPAHAGTSNADSRRDMDMPLVRSQRTVANRGRAVQGGSSVSMANPLQPQPEPSQSEDDALSDDSIL